MEMGLGASLGASTNCGVEAYGGKVFFILLEEVLSVDLLLRHGVW